MGVDQAKAATPNGVVSHSASADPELWPRAARHPGPRPFAGKLYGRMRAWLAHEIAGEVAEEAFERCDVEDVADRTLALIDGLGVRALIGEPAMPLERAPAVAAAALPRDPGMRERLTEPGTVTHTVNLTPRGASQ